MRLHTILSAENKECPYDLLILDKLVFTAHPTDKTYLAEKLLTIKAPIKSIVLHYDFMNKLVFLYFGHKDLLNKNTDYTTGVLASLSLKFEQLTIKQHKTLIDFFKKAQNVKADTYAYFTAHATGKYKVLLNQLQ